MYYINQKFDKKTNSTSKNTYLSKNNSLELKNCNEFQSLE